MTILRYNSLKLAIPIEWKKYFTENERDVYTPLPPHNFDMAKTVWKENFSKKVYETLAEDSTLLTNKFQKWNKELNTEICNGIYQFGELHRNIYVVTNITKYRSFQYRLTQRAIVTNIHLQKWGLKTSPLCSFCNNVDETYVHLFVTCPKISEIWKEIARKLQNEYKITELCFEPKNNIFNQIW